MPNMWLRYFSGCGPRIGATDYEVHLSFLLVSLLFLLLVVSFEAEISCKTKELNPQFNIQNEIQPKYWFAQSTVIIRSCNDLQHFVPDSVSVKTAGSSGTDSLGSSSGPLRCTWGSHLLEPEYKLVLEVTVHGSENQCGWMCVFWYAFFSHFTGQL